MRVTPVLVSVLILSLVAAPSVVVAAGTPGDAAVTTDGVDGPFTPTSTSTSNDFAPPVFSAQSEETDSTDGEETDSTGEEGGTPTSTPTPTPTPTETTEGSETAETTESSEPTETTEDSETTETTGDSEPTEATESSEPAEATEDSEPAEATDDSETTETVENAEDPETTGITEDSETTETTEGSEDTETANASAAGAAAEDGEDAASSAEGADVDGGDGNDDAGTDLPGGITPESAGAGVAVGAGALATGALARRALLSGSTASTSAASTMVATPRGYLHLVASSASEFTQRAHVLLSDWVGRLLGAAGYTKWAGDEPLEHDTRAELYDHIQAEPGTYLSAFEEASAVDASLGTVRYHLKILEREDLVTSENVQGKRRFYPIGSSPDALDVALDSESTRAILEALTASPDSVSGLAERIDRDPSTVTHHLSRLEAAGLVERERDGQSVTNRLTPGVRAALSQGPFAEAGSTAAADD